MVSECNIPILFLVLPQTDEGFRWMILRERQTDSLNWRIELLLRRLGFIHVCFQIWAFCFTTKWGRIIKKWCDHPVILTSRASIVLAVLYANRTSLTSKKIQNLIITWRETNITYSYIRVALNLNFTNCNNLYRLYRSYVEQVIYDFIKVYVQAYGLSNCLCSI